MSKIDLFVEVLKEMSGMATIEKAVTNLIPEEDYDADDYYTDRDDDCPQNSFDLVWSGRAA